MRHVFLFSLTLCIRSNYGDQPDIKVGIVWRKAHPVSNSRKSKTHKTINSKLTPSRSFADLPPPLATLASRSEMANNQNKNKSIDRTLCGPVGTECQTEPQCWVLIVQPRVKGSPILRHESTLATWLDYLSWELWLGLAFDPTADHTSGLATN